MLTVHSVLSKHNNVVLEIVIHIPGKLMLSTVTMRKHSRKATGSVKQLLEVFVCSRLMLVLVQRWKV